VYDPLFTDVYEAFVHNALNTHLMALLEVVSDDLSDVNWLVIMTHQLQVKLTHPKSIF
jgi:hypothetical protein